MNVFMRWSGPIGAGCVLFGLCQAAGPAAPEPNPQKIEVVFYSVPEQYSMLSGVLAHSNGKVYLAGSYHVARLYEVDLATREARIVARMTSQAEESGGLALKDPVLRGDLGDGAYPETKWKFAQDKIHTPLYEGVDGRVYGATHTKAEEPASTRSYPGGHFFAYDPKTEKVEDLGWARRGEGIITMCYDRERNVLYGLTWPTGYLVSCKPDEKDPVLRTTLLGLGSSQLDCVPRYFDVVKDGRVYVCDGATGNVRVYDPATKRLYEIPGLTTPTQPQDRVPSILQESTTWRNWWMFGVRSPDGMHLFTSGQRGGHLTEVDATQGKWGVVIDHGRSHPWGKDDWQGPWIGALVFGRDELLYHTGGGQLLTYDTKSGEVLDRGQPVLKGRPEVKVGLSRGACTQDGRLVFLSGYQSGEEKVQGVAILDPSRLTEPRRLRVSPRVVIRPLAERTAGASASRLADPPPAERAGP